MVPVEGPLSSIENTYLDTESHAGFFDLHRVHKVYKSSKETMHRHVLDCYEAVITGRSEAITDLDLRLTKLGAEGMMQVSLVLPFFTQLRSLGLWRTKFGQEGAEYLAKALLKLPLLKVLSLEGNDIQFEGLLKLSDTLKSLTLLEDLSLHINRLSPDGGSLLANIVACLPQLRQLKVDDNDLRDESATQLVESLANNCPFLVHLGLSYNGLTDTTASTLLANLDNFSNLQSVNFKGNSISTSFQNQLKSAKSTATFEF